MDKAILKKTETKYMARIPQREIVSAMSDLSSNSYKLLMYYYSRRDGWEFVEENMASVIGTSVRQLKKARKELIDKGYLLIQKGSVDVYFVGQGAVTKFLSCVVEEEGIEVMEPTISKKK